MLLGSIRAGYTAVARVATTGSRAAHQMPSLQAVITRFVVRNLLKPYLMSGPLATQRRRFASLAGPRRAAGARVEPVQIGELHGEWVEPRDADPARVLYYLHGGGFVACSPATHRRLAARIAREAGMRALLVDYRLAPEHPFPAAVQDAVAGYRWLIQNGVRPEHVVIAGDSAGGSLVLTTLLSLRDARDPLPAAGVCLSAVTDLTLSGASFTTRERDEALLSVAFCRSALGAYAGGCDPRTPLVSPLHAELHGLPPLLIHVGTHELLLDDSIRFAAKAEKAGVEVTLRVWDGMWHVFHAFEVPEARAAVRDIGVFMRSQLGVAREGARPLQQATLE
jgi:acetyl esterase/lipase